MRHQSKLAQHDIYVYGTVDVAVYQHWCMMQIVSGRKEGIPAPKLNDLMSLFLDQ